MSIDSDISELEWIDGWDSHPEFREWAQSKLLELAAKCVAAAQSGAATGVYFKGMDAARAALKDALLVYDKRHARDEIEEELQESRDLLEALRTATKEARESGGAHLGAPPASAGATQTH